MKKTSYFWLLMCVLINLFIWCWTRGLIQEFILNIPIAEQPVRTLEEIKPELIRLSKEAESVEQKLTPAVKN
jgi:hypothetical protein